MDEPVLIGLAIGVGLALLYAIASLITHRVALQSGSRNQFLAIAFGGLLARMAFALLLVTVTLVFVPVDETAFIGSFFGVFVVTLIMEVLHLHRQTSDVVREAAGDASDDARR
ncbi:hypothetical protein CRI94_09620 [Longibacter salinarum]|uniref:Uncharacterized protein n=1 Tax=Longibacter salinarum TaxID=1850348 RepID=A0A2A8CXV3_9BACT|nr:hypothetical protein [Longibacter salinarum]PEN13559.1 hypothetical protein CRI94_09620 [Longibacter salinarum]